MGKQEKDRFIRFTLVTPLGFHSPKADVRWFRSRNPHPSHQRRDEPHRPDHGRVDPNVAPSSTVPTESCRGTKVGSGTGPDLPFSQTHPPPLPLRRPNPRQGSRRRSGTRRPSPKGSPRRGDDRSDRGPHHDRCPRALKDTGPVVYTQVGHGADDVLRSEVSLTSDGSTPADGGRGVVRLSGGGGGLGAEESERDGPVPNEKFWFNLFRDRTFLRVGLDVLGVGRRGPCGPPKRLQYPSRDRTSGCWGWGS